jgi:methionyl-tRNA synthetase
MLQKRFGSQLSSELDARGTSLLNELRNRAVTFAEHFENRDFHFGMQTIREMAELANQYFDQEAPWKKVESEPLLSQQVLSSAINAFRIIMICLSPVVPSLAKKMALILSENSNYLWSQLHKPLLGLQLSKFEPLIQRIEKEALERLQGNSVLESD